jgi:hypothetical protein
VDARKVKDRIGRCHLEHAAQIKHWCVAFNLEGLCA